MSTNLKEKALRGVWWSAIHVGSGRLVQFTVGIILARLLLPEQFGLIGMLAVFLVLGQLLLDGGLGKAIVQRPNLSSVDISSAFYLNLLAGCTFAGALFLAAPAIATFFGCPELTALTRFMGLRLIVCGLSAVQLALLQRELRFKTLAQVNFVACLASGIVGLVLAFEGFGVWALAWQQFTEATLTAVAVWLLAAWRPSLQFSSDSVYTLFSYGSKLLASGILYQGCHQLCRIVIAKVYSPADLGFYTRATHLEETATMTVGSVISRVMFPVLAAVQNDPPRLKRALRQVLRMLALVTAPLMLGLMIVAKPLIAMLLGDKWLPSAPLLQVLCLVGALYPLHLINVQFLIATGRSGLDLKITAAKLFINLAIVLAVCYWGLLAIVLGQFASSLLAYAINSHYTAKLLGYSMKEQLYDVFPYYGAAAVMAIAILPLGFISGLDSLVLLLLQTTIGASVFLLLCHILRLQAFDQFRVETRSRLLRLVVGAQISEA